MTVTYNYWFLWFKVLLHFAILTFCNILQFTYIFGYRHVVTHRISSDPLYYQQWFRKKKITLLLCYVYTQHKPNRMGAIEWLVTIDHTRLASSIHCLILCQDLKIRGNVELQRHERLRRPYVAGVIEWHAHGGNLSNYVTPHR